MKLKTYLADQNITIKDFSLLLECHRNYISRIANGHIMPGKRLKKDIEYITDGNVKFLENTIKTA